HFSFQDGFYTPLLELAQKRVMLFSVFELLEEFCAECVFFFHILLCVKVSRKSYFLNFSRPLYGPKNSRITFPTSYTLIWTISVLRFYNVGCINSSVCSF